MKNSLRILLMLGVIVGVLPFVVSADPITNADVSIDFIINDGDTADLHGYYGWLVAGSGISSTIRVNYTGSGSPVIHFVQVTSVEKETYGDVSGGSATSLPCDVQFSASENVAGNAPIHVHVNYTDNGVGYDYYRTESQPIDHNTPMNIRTLAFESEVTINGTMEINLMMEDAYGNTVNSLYEDEIVAISEEVTFSTTSYAGSGFYGGTGYDAESVTVPVNAEGSVVAAFKVGTEAGPKYLIHLVPGLALDDKWLTITALADAEPYAIAVSVVPNDGDTPHIPADGESQFYLTYHLFDRYGNPSGNQTLHFNDSVFEDEFTQRTNSDGEVKLTFGPFERVDLFNIHAYAVGNISVTIDQELQFTSTAPVDMLLTANPEFMPSADVAPEFHASLLAKVIDESGNGVPGQEVEFFIIPRLYDGIVHDGDPFLNGIIKVVRTSATTNANGTATVNFTPGGLLNNVDGENKITPAFENCTVEATWTNVKGDIQKKRTILLTWMNYPYLRVETEVNPETVEVGDSVDVTIRLIGDGYALHPDPIDVMLCVDRSGSMDYTIQNSDGSSTTRMDALKVALKLFNTEMTETTDRVGMISFGGNESPYSNYAEKDLPLTPLKRTTLNETIDSLVPDSGTPMRGGLYEAIKEIIENPRADAVRAVIVLSDGDYNWYGDPLARGSGGYLYDGYWDRWDRWHPVDPPYWVWYGLKDFSDVDYDYYWYADLAEKYPTMIDNQSMSVYAANNNIKIYSISFGDDLSVNGTTTLETLAKSTGGKYYPAPDATKLAAIYTEIAGELKTEAGVNTTMDLKFTDIELNNVSTPNGDPENPDDPPFLEYEFVEDISTRVKSWNTTGSSPGSEENPNIKDFWMDQSNNWTDNNNQSLNFNTNHIGTIHLGQTWQAVFKLKVLREGSINIFGDGSMLYFNNGAESMTLPKTYITAAPLNSTGINFTDLQVTDLICVEADEETVITDYLTMEWNLSYSGNYAVTQDLYCQKVDDGIWNKFDTKPVSGPVVPTRIQTAQLYVADFPPGEYLLRVHAKADDTPDSIVETLSPITIGQGGGFFIRLE